MDLLTRVRAEKREPAQPQQVVLDGKTLRGTQQHQAPDQKKMHHLNLYEAKTGIVLKEARVEEKAGELNRAHWSIENRLHSRRDGALAEDACQVRKGSAPHVLAVLNSFGLALFDFCKVSNAKQSMRSLDAHPLQAARLLLKSLEEN